MRFGMRRVVRWLTRFVYAAAVWALCDYPAFVFCYWLHDPAFVATHAEIDAPLM